MRPSADTVLVWTGAPCAYGCGACPIEAPTEVAGQQADGLRQVLADLPGRGGRLAVLVGGEPFLRPDLLRLLAVVRAAECVPGIVTTGRPLVYPQMRDRLRRAGIAYLRIQLFGVGPAHDRAVSVAGAFEQAMAGLRAWLADAPAGCDVDVALSLRRRPVEGLVSEIELLAAEVRSPDIHIVVASEAADDATERADELRRAAARLSAWNDDPSRPLLAWEGLVETVSPAACLTVPPLRPSFLAAAPKACCLGAVEAIAARASGRPLGPKANSFNFVRTAVTVPWTADAAACTAYRSAPAEDLERRLWLVEDERLVLHATDTGDFARSEIQRIKEEWSHLFLDRAAAGVLDDFTEGMRRVLPDPVCDPCAHRARCARRYRVVDGAPFADEEAWIAAHVGGLQGRVLDVGCGEQLYRGVLAPLLRSGAVRYTGLDPDPPSLAAARAALPEGRFLLGEIEEFRGEAGSYDHVLCLRSLNHVSSLDEALARMAALLRPGGRLLIVETTPFALLRRPEQVAAADRAPRAGHQHFRNVTSADVLPFARRRALRVVTHHPVGRQATNEWILLLEKE